MRDNKTEQYKCQSYYDDDNVLRDCTCGKCAELDEEKASATPKPITLLQINKIL